MTKLAHDQLILLCQQNASLEGPTALDFARQMERMDVAAIIEGIELESVAAPGGRSAPTSL
jgi:hypothetical protein